MGRTLVAVARQAARLLIIELIVPGGTLIALSILLAGRVSALSERFPALSRLQVRSKRAGHGNDLVAYYGLRRIR